eukprot:497022_1
MINVIINCHGARKIVVSINASAKVSELKGKIHSILQTEMTESFELFVTHNGCKKQLYDNDTVADYGIISNQTTLLLVTACNDLQFDLQFDLITREIQFDLQFTLFNPAKSSLDRKIHSSEIQKLSTFDKDQSIDKIVENYLRQTDINPLFYSGYCPFQSINLRFRGNVRPLTLSTKDLQTTTFNGQKATLKSTFGLIPSDKLYTVISKCVSEQTETIMDQYYHFSHTCANSDQYFPKKCWRNHYSNFYESNGHESVFLINIDITMPTSPFLLIDKYYYINGEFYDKYDTKNNKMRLQFFPILNQPIKSNEKTLVFGYIRETFQLYYNVTSSDIIHLIYLFFPDLCGGKYEVSKYNKGISNKLRQKTKTFVVSGIEFCLRYVGKYARNYNYKQSGFYLELNGKKRNNISYVTFMCQLFCKLTKQSFTLIENFEGNKCKTVFFHDFGGSVLLGSMICNIQILNMLKLNRLYEYPLKLKQNVYLLEWVIDKKTTNMLKNGILSNVSYTFESGVFYNMFRLRCSSNKKGELIVAIQLIALPTNVSPLKTKCEIFAVETNHHVPLFNASFDYTRRNSSVANILLKMDEYIKNQDQLTIRSQIEIVKNEKDT